MTRLLFRLHGDRGQATAEYALVMVAAATIALALIVWASGTDLLPSFFNSVVSKVSGFIRDT